MKRLLLALALSLVTPLTAAAQDPTSDTMTYRVKKNDSLGLIAAEFYGDRNKAIFIMVANRIEHPRPLKPGERLKIPVSRQITTSPGDTYETLAETYLGDPRRGTFLAEFNGLSLEDSLASGTAISIPFTVTHNPSGTESITSIAAAYFGDSKNAAMIRRYNFLEKDAIEKGEQLIVPIHNVRLQASKMPAIDADSKARRERQRLAQGRATKAVAAARQAMREGEFAAVKSALAEVELDLDYLDTENAVAVGVLIGSMHLAYGDGKPALESFKRVLERKPTHLLSPYYYSPKILETWKEAGGAVEGTPGAP